MPDWKKDLERRFAHLRLGAAREAEIIEELTEHLEQRYAELRDEGVDEAAAVALVREEVETNPDLVERMRPLRQANVPPPVSLGGPRLSLLGDVWQDLRLAARMLRKQKALTLMVLLTLAIGIGANGALFALVDRVLLRDLPLPAPDRLVTIWERTETTSESRVAPLNLFDWMRRNRSFQAIGGFIPNTGSMVMSGPGGAETVSRQWVTAGIFDALGVAPIIGNTFSTADDADHGNVAVLSEAFWRTRFAADPSIVGQSMRFDGELFTIVGVVPQEAEVLAPVSMWAARSIQGLPERFRRSYELQTVARLKPDVSLEAARDDLARIAADLAREYPATNEGRGVTLEPFRDVVLGADLKRTSLLFLGVVGFVLLICFANIASLLLTRNAGRGNELAIRFVLGANRRRLLRQFATENLLLAALGGLMGLVLAGVMLRVAPATIPRQLLPAGFSLDLDWRVAVFCAGTTLLVATLFTLASGRQIGELASLRQGLPGGRGVTDRSSRTREALVVAQVATAVVLLYGAGLLTRTLLDVDGVDPGYRAPSVS